jgi:hypothetical protein
MKVSRHSAWPQFTSVDDTKELTNVQSGVMRSTKKSLVREKKYFFLKNGQNKGT